jgi:prepilin-type N-terminal cleavage/methylation domain-containing protein
MIRHRLAASARAERGFTLLEVLTVTIIIGVLAAIALAMFLNEREKGQDASAKSDVTNLSRLVQICNSGRDAEDDYRDCDTAADLSPNQGFTIDPTAPEDVEDCDDGDPGSPPAGQSRVAKAGKRCFVVVGSSRSGNYFWMVRRTDGSLFRDCHTRGVTGCPSDGEWAG